MEIGRLYSRLCGWEKGQPVKFYNSEIVEVFPKEICNIDGKTGAFIAKYMDKNNLAEKHEKLYKLCKTFSSWYFYYGEMKEITAYEN
jgi:hypothetical protein